MYLYFLYEYFKRAKIEIQDTEFSKESYPTINSYNAYRIEVNKNMKRKKLITTIRICFY